MGGIYKTWGSQIWPIGYILGISHDYVTSTALFGSSTLQACTENCIVVEIPSHLTQISGGHRSLTSLLNSDIHRGGHRSHPLTNWLCWYSTCAFCSCHCMGELVPKNNRSLFDWRKIIGWASLTFKSGHAQYHLPYHKRDPFHQGSDVTVTTQDVADPVSLLWTYVQLQDCLHGAKAALFLHKNGSHLTRSWFELKFFAVLDRQFGGHSPRTGYATFLVSLGIPESIIQAVGQWSSEAWKIHIWENPIVRVKQPLVALWLCNL